jgi:hypothetical protein
VRLRPEASRVERWVRGWIAAGQYAEFLQVLGPFPQPRALMLDAEKSLIVEEQSWREKVALLRAAGIYQPSDQKPVHDVAGSPVLSAADVIPRSWACTSFDGTPCQFKGICHREPGWEDLEGVGRYEIRTPHHAIEKTAMTETITALGLHWTDPEDEEAL